MLLEAELSSYAYKQIRKDALAAGGGCTVLILCAPTADAMCACRILCSMLRSDVVSYSVHPVISYSKVFEIGASLEGGVGEEIRSLVMLECGATVDMKKHMLPYLNPLAKVYIWDSHRPVHLANVYEEERIVTVNDNTIAPEDLPSDGEGLDGAFDEDSEDEDDDEEEEEDGENEDSGERRGRRSARTHSDGEDEFESEEEEEGSGGEGGGSDEEGTDAGERRRKRRKSQREVSPERRSAPQVTVRDSRAQARARRARVRTHYASGQHYGHATAISMYVMSMQLDKDNNDLLWLAIVGLTDQFLHKRIADDRYISLHSECTAWVIARNPPRGHMETSDKSLVPIADAGRIVFEQEFRFMLHRHWSLYESMYFSNYVASKLCVWKARGREKLEELLAKIGVGLQQCKQKFPFMSSQMRRRLKEKLVEYGDKYGLDDITYGSFVRYLGFSCPISAADIVYCVTALVEHVDLRDSVNVATQEAKDGDDVSIDDNDDGAWLDGFNAAYDLLGAKAPDVMQKGLELSMSLQKAIVNLAISIMEKGQIIATPNLRYAYIHAEASDERLFTQPLALGKLAMFMVDVHRENGAWAGKRARPLVLLAEREETYLVVAVTCAEKEGLAPANNFSNYFLLAAGEGRMRMKHDGFDTSVAEIRKEDATMFMENLVDALSAR
jgi:cell division control protein 45